MTAPGCSWVSPCLGVRRGLSSGRGVRAQSQLPKEVVVRSTGDVHERVNADSSEAAKVRSPSPLRPAPSPVPMSLRVRVFFGALQITS